MTEEEIEDFNINLLSDNKNENSFFQKLFKCNVEDKKISFWKQCIELVKIPKYEEIVFKKKNLFSDCPKNNFIKYLEESIINTKSGLSAFQKQAIIRAALG